MFIILLGCLYIFEIDPLLVALVANIFSHSEGCLFICLWLPLLCKSVLSWNTEFYLETKVEKKKNPVKKHQVENAGSQQNEILGQQKSKRLR